MLVIEIDNAKDKNAIVNLVYRPPNGSTKTIHEYLKLFLDDYYDNDLFLRNVGPTKGAQPPYFHPGPLSEVLTIVNLRHVASRI